MRRKKKNNYLIAILLLLLVGIGIGYAALSATLNISGKSTIGKSTWDLHFANVKVTEGSVEATKVPTISDNTAVDFEVALNLPGDFYEFTINVVNGGSIDAMIESIVKTPELTPAQSKYLNYTVTYQNGEQIQSKQLVAKESFVRLKVRVEFKKDVNASDLPTTSETLNLGLTVNYVQADDSGVNVKDNGLNLISFKYNDEVFYALEGMTWWYFIASEYNTNNAFSYNPQLGVYHTDDYDRLVSPEGWQVSSDRVIQDGEVYS